MYYAIVRCDGRYVSETSLHDVNGLLKELKDIELAYGEYYYDIEIYNENGDYITNDENKLIYEG